MASNTIDNTELINYVLSGATETLCESLDPAQVIRRLISTHHLTDDDKREINSSPRSVERVEKLLEIMKLQDKAAYDDFMKALREFHPHLYEDVYEFETKYHNGARPKKRTPRKPTEDQYDNSDGNQTASNTQQNTFNFGDTHNTTHNTANSVQRNYSTNHIQNCVNIHGDHTVVGGNVYNIKGDCVITNPGGTTYTKKTTKPFKFTETNTPNYTYAGPGAGEFTQTTYTHTEFKPHETKPENGKEESKTKPKEDHQE